MTRHTLAFLAILAISCPAVAQATPNQAPDQTPARQTAEMKALLASVDQSLDRQQEMLKALTRGAERWSKSDRAKVRTFFQSEKNTIHEKQIDFLTTELRTLFQSWHRGEIKGVAAERQYVARIRQLAAQLQAVVEEQSAHLNQELNNLALSKQP